MSRIRTNLITNRMANGAPTVSNGLVISGVTTSTTFSGSGASLTNLPSAQLTGALPAIDGSNLTGLAADKIFEGNTEVEVVDTGSDGHVKFTTEGTERLRIHSGGQVQIAGDSIASISHFADDLVIGESGSSAISGLTLCSTDSSGIRFHDTADMGEIEFDHSDNSLAIKANQILKFRTNNGERLRITSGGVVNIGGDYSQTSVSTQITGDLLVQKTASAYLNPNIDIYNYVDGGYAGSLTFSGKIGGSKYSQARIRAYGGSNTSDGSLAIETGNMGEKLRIDSSGRLLLGTTSRGQDDADNLTIDGSGEGTGRTGLTIRSATNTFGSIFFSDATSGAGQYDGVVAYDHSTQTMRFSTASTQHMFINSNGVVTMPNTPAFRATLSGGPQGINGTVPFDTVDYNVGSNFNNSNHRFTAPVAGRYAFHFYSIYRGNHNNAAFGFYKNGSGFGGDRAHFTRQLGGYWDYIDMSQVLNLAAGDYVTCLTHSAVDLHGGNWAAFSGHLVG